VNKKCLTTNKQLFQQCRGKGKLFSDDMMMTSTLFETDS